MLVAELDNLSLIPEILMVEKKNGFPQDILISMYRVACARTRTRTRTRVHKCDLKIKSYHQLWIF